MNLDWSYLGRLEYRRALRLQQQLRDQVADSSRADTLLLLEHPPVITLGRSAGSEHILAPKATLAEQAIEVVRAGRGGDVTYHGPGQLVGYPIRQVGRAIRAHVEGMCAALGAYLQSLGIESWWDDSAPGLWTAGGKIAAVGVDGRGGVTTHGFALNLSPRLEHFSMIVPCGIPKPVTSVEGLLGEAPPLEAAALDLAERLARAYGASARQVDSARLTGLVGS